MRCQGILIPPLAGLRLPRQLSLVSDALLEALNARGAKKVSPDEAVDELMAAIEKLVNEESEG
jgi:hypothetical protein